MSPVELTVYLFGTVLLFCLFCDVHNRSLVGGLCCQHCISLTVALVVCVFPQPDFTLSS